MNSFLHLYLSLALKILKTRNDNMKHLYSKEQKFLINLLNSIRKSINNLTFEQKQNIISINNNIFPQMEKKDKETSPKPKKKTQKNKQHKMTFNIPQIIEQLKKKQALTQDVLMHIIKQSNNLLKNQPNVLRMTSPVVIVGDIHGQFYDLLNIFQKFGFPPHTKYLFLGDYVDRGRFCIEVITLVLILKLTYPDSIHLLRGNHEGRVMTTSFNFKIQCQAKYPSGIYQHFMDLFIMLPLCAIIDNRYFAVHGGLSPSIKTIDQIQKMQRFWQIPQSGTLCDLLWSDPVDQNHDSWNFNKNRSCSYFYSKIQAQRFLNTNSLKMIIRGHQVQMKGFKYQMGTNNQPLTLTIFSAPKYCDSYRNKGAVAIMNGKNITIQSFKEVQHPFILGNYLNAFQLSFPVIASSATKIFTHFLKNKKLTKSMKKLQNSTLEQIQFMNNLFSSHADTIQKVLGNAATQNNQELKDIDGSMAQGLLQFMERNTSKNSNEHMPLIFGPKHIQFVKVQHKIDDEDDQPTG